MRQCDNAFAVWPLLAAPSSVIRPVKCLIKRRHLRPSHAPYRAAKLRQISRSLSLSLSVAIALLQFFCGQQIAFTLIGFQMLSPWSHLLGALRLPPPLPASFIFPVVRAHFVCISLDFAFFIHFICFTACLRP